jgi:uncharacterized membrane protein YraQ (UPF0718 family)
MIGALKHALAMACAMGWEILWPLILGFALSGVVQAVVSHREIARLLPDDRPRSIARALALGAASSSCSYAAVALARSLFRKGANFTAAMAFELASTNLVIELSIILLVLMGWHFVLAEALGALFMVALLVILFRMFLHSDLINEAKAQADRAIAGRMDPCRDGHLGDGRRFPLAKNKLRKRADRHLALFRHGRGCGLARHRRRAIDFRRAGRVGSRPVLAILVPDRPPFAR